MGNHGKFNFKIYLYNYKLFDALGASLECSGGIWSGGLESCRHLRMQQVREDREMKLYKISSRDCWRYFKIKIKWKLEMDVG